MKMCNGYGSIYKVSRKERNPYKVKITIGYELDEKTGKTKEIRRLLGAFPTWEKANACLVDYHRNKNILKQSDITFKELFDKWSSKKFLTLSESSIYSYNHAFDLVRPLHNIQMRNIRLCDLQDTIDSCNKNYPILKTILILYKQLYSFAMVNDLILKDYSKGVDISQYKNENPNKQNRDKFSNQAINEMWSSVENRYDMIILMLIYTGVRINELLNLKKENVHLNERYFDVIHSKTINGVRQVPIADKIYPFFEEWYSISDDYMFINENGKKLDYDYYRRHHYKPFVSKLSENLSAHCCRHTFISLMVEADIKPLFIKLIVGHAGALSLTEKVYTHIDIETLLEAVNKI